MTGSTKIAKLLIDAGAGVNLIDASYPKMTPLMLACEQGYEDSMAGENSMIVSVCVCVCMCSRISVCMPLMPPAVSSMCVCVCVCACNCVQPASSLKTC